MRFDHVFVCPEAHSPLELLVTSGSGDEVMEGELSGSSGARYRISGGMPHLVYPATLAASEAESNAWYERNHEVYDDYLPLTFATFGVDETEHRLRMIEMLGLEPHHKVLETGAGTGRDSTLLAAKLGPGGELHVTDLFDKMLERSRAKLAKTQARIVHCVANAMHLPYPDRYFDAYYHFGGINSFSDKSRTFSEISRVVKPGGKVVIGDESIAPWLRQTEFGAILMNSNPYYRCLPPLQEMHVSARDVSLQYVLGGACYVLAYTVGEGEPQADFDLEIPGRRGGTHRTRFEGRLEGISREAVRLAETARASSGQSMHRWLDDAVRAAAERQLKGRS